MEVVYKPTKKCCTCEESNKKWYKHHLACVEKMDELFEVVIYGASNIRRHEDKWSNDFGRKCVNFGYGGDRIEHLLYRVVNGRIPKTVSLVVVHIGSNNIGAKSDSANKIAKGIVQVCHNIHERRRDDDIIVTSCIPWKNRQLKKVELINTELGKLLQDNNMRTFYIALDLKEWTIEKEGSVIPDPGLYIGDQVHLNVAGYEKLVSYIQQISVDTCMPLFRREHHRQSLPDVLQELAIGGEVHDEPPPLWNPLFAPARCPKYMPSVEYCSWWKHPKRTSRKYA